MSAAPPSDLRWLDAPTDNETPSGAPAEKSRDGKGPSAATLLVQIALDRYTLGVAKGGEPFAVPIGGPRIARLLRGGKDSLRSELAGAYFEQEGKAAPQQALADALLVVEGKAKALKPTPLHLRVAQDGDDLLLDLGDTTGRIVRITASGWQIEQASPVLFRRTVPTGALPAPIRGGDLDELWQVLNVSDPDRPLVLAWLLAALFPDLPHPVLTLRAEHGSGKSTATRTLAALLDPSQAQVRKPPRDGDAWVTAAEGSWIVAVDNVSTVPEWWSDALCRAVTGDGDVRRQLYTDGDLVVFAFRRAVVLNGIDLGAVRGDLADRLLSVELARIPDTGRRRESEIHAAWAEAHPRILGALLDLAVEVLATLPAVQLDRLPRMADFAVALHAVDRVLDTEGLARYTGQAGDLAADAVESDPALAAIVGSVRERWTGSAAELLAKITPDDDEARPPKGWPKDARTLTSTLRRDAPTLRQLGWTVEVLGRKGKAKALQFLIEPPPTVGNGQARQATTPDRRATASDDARPPAPPLTCDNAEMSLQAGKAGKEYASSLCPSWEEVESGPTYRDGPQTLPALPAGATEAGTPTPPPDGQPTGRSRVLGPCARCGTRCRRYGQQANPLCPSCQILLAR